MRSNLLFVAAILSVLSITSPAHAVVPQTLIDAVWDGNHEEVTKQIEYLPAVSRVETLNERIDGNELKLLHVAAHEGHRDVAALLIELGATVDARTDQQLTPLHLAAQNGHWEVVTLLFEYRAAVNARTDQQLTPLHLAAQDGHGEVAALLIELGATVDARTDEQFTPLHLAAQDGHRDVAALLIERGADPRLKIVHQMTASQTAEQAGYLALAEYLATEEARRVFEDRRPLIQHWIDSLPRIDTTAPAP